MGANTTHGVTNQLNLGGDAVIILTRKNGIARFIFPELL
jgi:hypothetical protein